MSDTDQFRLGGKVIARVHDERDDSVETRTAINEVLEPYEEYYIDLHEPNVAPASTEATHFAIGTDDTSNESQSARFLGSEEFRSPVTGSSPGGVAQTEILAVVDATEANNFAAPVAEVGLIADTPDTPINRAVIDPPITKNEFVAIEFAFIMGFVNDLNV